MQCAIVRDSKGVNAVRILTGTGFRVVVSPDRIEICELDDDGQAVSRLSARLDGLVSPPRRPPWEEPGFGS